MSRAGQDERIIRRDLAHASRHDARLQFAVHHLDECIRRHLVARSRDRWPLAGDQIFADLDLSVGNLPAGTRLQIGEAVIEITGAPHLGCGEFKARFGAEAVAFVNSEEGRRLRLRGANARIVAGGIARVGDRICKLGG